MDKLASETIMLDQWQEKWDNSIKGRWTYKFFPDVRQRKQLPIPIDHYIAQIVTGHGDFNGKLRQFNLSESPQCSCGHEEEMVDHLLFDCTNYDDIRSKLKDSLSICGIEWPFEPSVIVTSRVAWSALGKFAAEALTRKEKKRLDERIRLREEEAEQGNEIVR